MRYVTVQGETLPGGRSWLAVEGDGETTVYCADSIGEYVARRLLEGEQVPHAS